MLNQLQEQILKDVYYYDYFPNMQYYGGEGEGYGDPSYGWHEPTFEFLEAWVKETIKARKGGESSISIKFDPKMLTKSVHKSLEDGRDVRRYLAQILNVDGYTSGMTVGSIGNPERGIEDTVRNVSKLRRPYWNRFVAKMKKGTFRNIIKKQAAAKGIKLT